MCTVAKVHIYEIPVYKGLTVVLIVTKMYFYMNMKKIPVFYDKNRIGSIFIGHRVRGKIFFHF